MSKCHIVGNLMPQLNFHLNSGKEEKDGQLYNWKEVTAEFLDASNDLELGELLHDSS